jgi:hypothetical protein
VELGLILSHLGRPNWGSGFGVFGYFLRFTSILYGQNRAACSEKNPIFGLSHGFAHSAWNPSYSRLFPHNPGSDQWAKPLFVLQLFRFSHLARDPWSMNLGNGAAWVTRTPDPRITNAMLYQLS